MQDYNPQKIEPKWQKRWEKEKLYQAEDFSKKPKKYILVEFPYISGVGLHVGHARSYAALDALARKKRMEGFNVLFPIGWDAFGLPAENYAIRKGVHPRDITDKNIKTFRRQTKSLGLSFDWSREIDTTDPKYYKWSKWIFLKLFEKGLAYKKEMPINWCPACKIGLANEEVVSGQATASRSEATCLAGKCERCGTPVERRKIKQWMLKITKYADRLLKDLDKVDYLPKIKAQQKNWIGKSMGVEVVFKIKNQKLKIKVFTTRLDTIFGVTALVLAPEHPIIQEIATGVATFRSRSNRELKLATPNLEEVKKYCEQARKKSELERTELAKIRTGVELKGIKAINPVNGEEVPVWVADYVIPTYGGGAVMMVPAHDKRDYSFAKKYKLEIRQVIQNTKYLPANRLEPQGDWQAGKIQNTKLLNEAFVDYGILVNSGKFSGLSSKEAIGKIAKWLKDKGLAKKKIEYKLRDWIFSRQHYWGEPIPLVFCENCAVKIKNQTLHQNKFGAGQESKTCPVPKRSFWFGVKNKGELLNPGWVPVPEEQLPVELPYVVRYEPTETGESPLANIKKWVNVKCPKCGGAAKRETDTMPNWAGSNWYYLRYCDPKNDKQLADPKKLLYWLAPARRSSKSVGGVDLYNGGMEHTTLHLLYSRFWHKFLYDIGVVPTIEPYQKRTSHGMVLASDGRKMSKSFGNVVSPDDIIRRFGADTLRLYEMFMGPFEQAIGWDDKGVEGCYRFLRRVWKKISARPGVATFTSRPNRGLKSATPRRYSKVLRKLHWLIKKVTEDLESMKFNTAVAAFMEFINVWQARQAASRGEAVAWQEEDQSLNQKDIELFLKILSPFAPHITEELWWTFDHKNSIFNESWPKYNPKLILKESFELVIQINGKVRDKVEVAYDISEDEAKRIVLEREKVQRWIKGKRVKKTIFVAGRLINLVVS